MKRDEFKQVVDAILSEKLQILFGKVDFFQTQLLNLMDQFKNFDDFADFSIPSHLDFSSGEASPSVDILNEYVKKISASTNQLNLINSILDGIIHFCNRGALFLLRDDKLVGWKGKGFSGNDGEITDEELKKIFFSLSANTIFKWVLEKKQTYAGAPLSQPDDFLIYNRLGGKKPDHVMVMPFFVKGKPQAIIYTDADKNTKIMQKEIEIIAAVGEMSLDLLPLKQKILSRVKTQEFLESNESDVQIQPEISTASLDDEMEKTAKQTVVKGNDPKRLARVIINDIILYNQKVIEDGIRNKNLYSVLKETLEQAKELYLRKFNDLSHFEEQMIAILARGDKDALKGYHFEVF